MNEIYWGLKNDGEYYAAPEECEFIKSYENSWNNVIANTYFPSEKNDMGHKLRPRLVYWGYLSISNCVNSTDIDLLGKLGVGIELIHKASLLLDDYIDKDLARHGKSSFYIEYGIERMIMYSLNLLSKSLELINEVFSKKSSIQYFSSMHSIILMLNSMTEGVLRELDLGKISTQNIEEVQTIMALETSELISSSLVSGYNLAGGDDSVELNILMNIGQKIGFVFQLFNDLEPFVERIHTHKGKLNIDVIGERKNYCIALLNELTNSREKKKLDLLKENKLEDYIFSLLQKYDVLNLVLQECKNTFSIALIEVEKSDFSSSWKEHFSSFLSSVYAVSNSRLN